MEENHKPTATPTLTFGQALKTVFSKYVTFSGRARRSEYWWFAAFQAIVALCAMAIDLALGQDAGDGTATLIVSIALLLPSLGVTVRRLHDTGNSGWWVLVVLIPLLGAIALLYWCVQDSDADVNEYGPSPKYV